MRSKVATLGLCILILVAYTALRPSRPVSAQDCGGCTPPRIPGVQLSGNYHVCFDQNVIGGEQAEKMAYGFEHYWTGTGVTFDHETTFPDSSCDIIIDAAPLGAGVGAEATPTSNGRGAKITVNSSKLNDFTGPFYYDYWAATGAHEMGHILGFDNQNTSGCQNATIMYLQVFNSYPSSPLCSDSASMQTYTPRDPDPVCLAIDQQCFDDSDCCENNCNMTCRPVSPILIDIKSNTASYRLTSARNGVTFDLNVDGTPERIGWTEPESPIALLAWDRNQNGKIDNGSELFGNMTPNPDGTRARNGFEALLDWDGGVGVSDGKVDSQDLLYADLRLWFDRNHNGISESNELVTLFDAGLVALFTSFRETPRVDRHGNRYWLEGTVLIQRNGTAHPGRAFDVIFATETAPIKRKASARGR